MGITTVPTKPRLGFHDLANPTTLGLPVLLWMSFWPWLAAASALPGRPPISLACLEAGCAGSLTQVCLPPNIQVSAADLRQLQQGI